LIFPVHIYIHTCILVLYFQGSLNVNIRNDHGWTALMFAARNGHTNIVKELLNNKYVL
jgi:ankyrin repeat protein